MPDSLAPSAFKLFRLLPIALACLKAPASNAPMVSLMADEPKIAFQQVDDYFV